MRPMRIIRETLVKEMMASRSLALMIANIADLLRQCLSSAMTSGQQKHFLKVEHWNRSWPCADHLRS